VTAYGPTAGKEAGQIYRAIRDGMARTARDERVTTSWCGASLDRDGLRHWFRDKIDGMINLKAGLRSDGARKREKCRCRACLHQHGHDLERGRLAIVRCYHCPSREHLPYGRKWENDYQIGAWRDSRRARERVTQRIAVRQFETEDARKRLGHLLSTWED